MGIVGAMLIGAGMESNPNKSKGIVGAFQTLAGEPAGPLLLGVIAIGIISYAVFMFAKAKYRRIVVA